MLADPIRLLAIVVAIGLGHARNAWAQESGANAAAAEALFQEGRALLIAGKVDEACPKLEESQRLDPATGTLMAVALCREQQGKLASAWAAFADIQARSRLDGRADRERIAREHGASLRPRLSSLTLVVPKETADAGGFAISLDGMSIGRGAWNVPIPIDGGDHVIGATATGRKPWSTSISVGGERDHARVAVPALSPLVAPAPRMNLDPTAGGATNGRPQRIIGLSLVGAGLLGLGTAALVALDAKGDYDAAVAGCPGGACPPDLAARARDAQDQGDMASVIAIAAGVVAIGGAALWFWSPRPTGAGARPAPTVASGARSLLLTLRF